MAKIIAFTNQKGGVGKTTSTFNVGVTLANGGNKTLIIDFDPQASLTICAGLDPYEIGTTVAESLRKQSRPMGECIVTLRDNLDIAPAREELADVESYDMATRSRREGILGKAVESIRSNYEYILIDCPPSLGLLTVNALSCADHVIIPVATKYLAYKGLVRLNETIDDVKSEINPELDMVGVIATLYNMRENDDKDVLEVLSEEYNVLSIVKRLTSAATSIYEGKAVLETDPNSEIAKAYNEVAHKLKALS